jgi:hypothetical protein
MVTDAFLQFRPSSASHQLDIFGTFGFHQSMTIIASHGAGIIDNPNSENMNGVVPCEGLPESSCVTLIE